MDLKQELIERLGVPENWDKYDYQTQRYSFDDLQEVLEDIVKKLTIPVVTCSADEAITLFNFYAEKSCENIKGQLVPVRKEYLEQYKTIENWLKTRHKHYR